MCQRADERRAAIALLDQDQSEGGDAEGAAVGQLPDQRVGFDDAGRPHADQEPEGQQQQAQADQRRPALPAPLSLP